MNNIFKKIKDTLPSTAEVQGAIQGIIGDKLPGKFATTMDFYADGKRQNTDLIPLQKHVVIFIHGNSDTELGWRKKNTPFNFGDNLMRDFAVTPLYIRYNSGLAVSENGEKLTALLEAFVQKHTKVKSLTLVAHSMGGLITHAAIYHARAQEKIWLTKLKQVFLLGTPHEGAPLAKFAEKSEQILQFIPNPVTLMAASVISLRSRGLKDLSHGQSGLPSENVVLQKNVHYVLIAGGLGQNENGVVNKVVGDGMVRRPSATQKQMPQSSWLSTAFPWFKKSTPISVEVLSGVGHLALRTSDEVYAVIQKYFRN